MYRKKITYAAIIISAVIVVIIGWYLIRKKSVVEYRVAGGVAGIRDEFVIRKNGCFNLNWTGSGLVKGSLNNNKLGSIKQVFKENNFLGIDYNPGQSVSDDFYASISYIDGKSSNNIAFGLEALRHFKPNMQVSNILSKLDSVISDILKERKEKITEGYLRVEVQKNRLQKWIFEDDLNLEKSLSIIVGEKRKINIEKEKIPDKIHQYFTAKHSQEVEKYVMKGDSSTLGITGGGLYFQDGKVYGVTAVLNFDDYKESKISSLFVYDETITQWPKGIDIPFTKGEHLMRGDVYKQAKNFTDSVKIAQFYKSLENDAAVYIINLIPKLDSTSLIDNIHCF